MEKCLILDFAVSDVERDRFYPSIAICMILALLSAAIILFNSNYILLAGMGTAASIISLRFAKNFSLRKGRDDRMKATLSSTSIVYELILLLAVFSLPIIPRYLIGVTLAAVLFSELFRLEMVQKLQTSPTRYVDREKRMIVLATSIGAHSFNNYLLYYGVLIIAIVSVYGSVKTLYSLKDQI